MSAGVIFRITMRQMTLLSFVNVSRMTFWQGVKPSLFVMPPSPLKAGDVCYAWGQFEDIDGYFAQSK
ncbi:hypothetical protein KCP74_10030 [Salmonella enterica subsp. enterica]|nr:hypothetical protein KCP74_10030 [Salmonella enterica subsp. enterica]